MGTIPDYLQNTGTLSSVVLNSTGVDPSNAIFISPEDSLYVVNWSSVAGINLLVNLRILDPDGSIKLSTYTIVTTGSRSPSVMVLPAGQGQVLGVVLNAFSANTLHRGALYASVLFLRGNITQTTQYTQVLVRGYVTAQSPLFYPFGPNDDSLSGMGNIRSIAGTTPGAGAEISETVPAGALWRVLNFRFSFTASVTAATRLTFLLIDDGANQLSLIPAPGTVAASIGATFGYAPGLNAASASGPVFTTALPQPLILAAGYRMRTLTASLQAGDQYSGVQYEVEEFIQT